MQTYLWIKSLHIIAVISWLAGMLYLPRLLVYHAENSAHPAICELFKVMERRLLRFIMLPAVILVWGSGLILVWERGVFFALWLQTKIAFVLLLSGVHIFLECCVYLFVLDRNRYSARFYRWINEVPTIIMITVVILVVFQP